MRINRLIMLVEIALFSVLAFLMDYFIPRISWGINFSFAMLPVFILALRWGIVAGMTSGAIWGILQIISGQAAGYIVNPFQGFLEYILAFSVIGLAGILAQQVQNEFLKKDDYKAWKVTTYSVLGIIIGAFLRYFIHFIAGVVYWGQYAPEGQTAVVYSLLTNSSSFLSEFVTCLIVLVLLIPAYKVILYNKRFITNEKTA